MRRLDRVDGEEAMLALGATLGRSLPANVLVFLTGDLGAGKTTLVRGMLRGLGFAGHVKSPTYTLVEPYDVSGIRVYHFDFYRIEDPAELEYIGLDELLAEPSIKLIEWPERGAGRLPAADVVIRIGRQDGGRRVEIEWPGGQDDP
jgi:tRNA threonylcarbamoyladenosine biosynthesis protein TsaE